MYSKTSLMALCAAVAVKEVAAGHGHQHAHADKREIVWAATETVVVTDYVVVTVTEGEEPTAAAVTPSSTPVAVTTTTRVRRPHHHTKQHSSVQSETSTSVVIPESTPSVEVPIVTPTTLATVTRPATTSVAQETPIETPIVSPPVEVTSVIEEPTIIPTTSAVFTPTSSSSAAPAPTSHSGGKRGLAFNDASLVQEFLTLGGQASWAYNWGSSSASLPEGVTFYPMLWSPAPDHSNGWDGFAADAISKGADALLSFNEPDIASQANMSPADAAAGHIQWMNPYSGKARISTPAISSSANANQGIDWLKQFFNACNGQCAFDFCAAHWYGPGGADGAGLFLQHLKDVNEACDGKPVWVTEFAAEGAGVDEFMTTVVESLESEEFSFVEKYSYFFAAVGQLFTSPTELSSFGKIYAGVA
ncbi:glycosyl hydrolase catalytic core-domain-containing protein [Xylaria bambusicola]|uniref:glycosyl hydrolase catalytic core-domain-containing protein n=1 Tax=Xylaria bambusicola TaxID=326684 RepID=UPI0020078BCC|nr:glycosyl hydrolase catalytic core-domain-containing protein [Xylaria bambusicola]KAI0513175.1 glycosyl hydrolase catalytic core-domain-containing protein [Xylaria bambusicola]